MVKQIHQHIHQYVGEGDENDTALYHRIVAFEDAIQQRDRPVMVGGEHARFDIGEVEREICERLNFRGRASASELGSHLREFYRGWNDGNMPRLLR